MVVPLFIHLPFFSAARKDHRETSSKVLNHQLQPMTHIQEEHAIISHYLDSLITKFKTWIAKAPISRKPPHHQNYFLIFFS